MEHRVLIKGGCVLTLDKSVGNFRQADVLIENDLISEIGTGLRSRDAEVVDGTDTIVMPGFVDTHRHLWNSLFRNLGTQAAIAGPEVYGALYKPDDVYAATLIGLLGAAEAGITTVVDWAELSFQDQLAEAALQAHTDSGLRTIFVGAVNPWNGRRGQPRTSKEQVSGAMGPRTTVAFGSESPAELETSLLAEEWRVAREQGLRIHAHVGSTSEERGITAGLVEAGLLGPDVTLVHCTKLDDADLDAIASSGAHVSLTPTIEMIAGLGAPPLQKLIDIGIRPGLGIGGELEAPGDLFSQMRTVNSIQHATLFDLKLAGKGGVPNLLSTRDVIRYATTDGAGAVGLGDITGSLTPGKKADIIVLRADRPNIAPLNDPIGAVVWGMDTSNVDWVFVDGEPLMRDGALVADTHSARTAAIAAQTRISEEAGLLVQAGEAT
ncbi:MAG: amidohydrolase family protein [Acidimicrobiia bacterium]